MRRAVSKRRDPLDCAGAGHPPAKLKRKRLKSRENSGEARSTSEDTDKPGGPQEALTQIPINATLTGSDCCEALGITARGYAPVLDLCRALVAAGHGSRRPLYAYRGDVLALSISSIGEGAQLTVREDRCGPRFVKWEPFPRRVRSRTREKTEGVGTALDQDNEPIGRPGATNGMPI